MSLQTNQCSFLLTAQIHALCEALNAEMLGTQPGTAGQAPENGVSNLTWGKFRGMMDKLELEHGGEPGDDYIRIPQSTSMSFQATLTPAGEAWRDSLFRPAVNLVEVEPGTKYRQARTHRRRRINKKWRKRWGMVREPDYYLGDKVVYDFRRNVGYCHPPTARKIEYEMLRRDAQ